MDRPNPADDARNGKTALDEQARMNASVTTDPASDDQNSRRLALETPIPEEPAGNEFFSYLSHEVQKPMSGIIGMVDLLKGTALTLEQSTYIEMIRHNSERLMTMITDILDVSRIQSETLELESIDFDLRMMLKDISRRMSVRAAEKFIAYQCTISPGVPARFKGDPGRIRQILISLLDNAMKYTSEGSITLRVNAQTGTGSLTTVAFDVTDTGIGIPEARREHLFASFSPSEQKAPRPSVGTGLGLSIAKQLCEMMGGDMHLESRLGEGSSVSFTVQLENPSDDGGISVAGEIELSNLRVLIVDDSLTHQDILKKQLISWGCRYEGVPDGWRAIDALRKAAAAGDPFQIAIVDMALPDMSGETIGERIKRDPSIRDTRLMMIAVIGKRGDARKYQDIGFSAYLVKPLKPAQLSDSLRMVMGRKPALPPGRATEIITRHTLMENRKKNIRILFVEPDATMQAAGGRLLKNLGYRSDPVQSGEEAMVRMKNQVYDLVIMEMMLPKMDGYEMIRQVRGMKDAAASPDTPILCLVASGAEGAVDRAIHVGADAVLTKPFGADELERMIDPLLRPHPVSDGQKPDGIFDEKWLREQLGDNEEMIRALIKGFLKKTPAHLHKLKEQTRAKNAERIRELGNILKGTSLVIGAHALYKIAFQIEVAGQNAAYSMMPTLIRNLEEAFGDLSAAMASSPFTLPSVEKAPDPVNMKIVLEIFSNNQELLKRFFIDFMKNSKGILSDIQSAVEERDGDRIKLNAHKLKGSLRYLAAEKAIACASRLEAIAREGRLEEADDAFEGLTAAYQEVRHFISEIQAAES